MARFFINRPIVAMVIAILTVIIGVVSMVSLPVAQYPDIVPPQVQVSATYIGADALTVEQSVATPIEQQMSGVDNMEYMSSINANNGQMTLTVNFGVETDPDTDQILAQMRVSQAESQLPSDVRNQGITVQKSLSSPLLLFSIYSPNDTYDNVFLANYAYINLNDEFTRVPGIASVTIFGAGQYAMRLWVDPDVLAERNITVSEIIMAVNNQNRVNPAGQVGAEPIPSGQEFTYTVRAQGRLVTEEEFEDIIVRADPDGSFVRVRDVARVELGAQNYAIEGRFDGRPAAIIALYQLPGSNALKAAAGAREMMETLSKRFPVDLEYDIALDTTLAVTAGVEEIQHTLFEALMLVLLVVFIFLQGLRATLIPLIAVPVSLIGTFIFFPMLGFSINTLSLFGLVLAIGLVVDDAIVVVEAVEHNIEQGLSPKEATLKAMREVSGPIMAIALILAAVFIPTVFIPGITGRLYQQFAITIAISMLISAFNALTLSPALAALLLRPKKESKGLLARFFGLFNRGFTSFTHGYVNSCHFLIKAWPVAILILLAAAAGVWFIGKKLPPGFIPEEDQGYAYAAVILPPASSLQRTTEIGKQVEDLIEKIPGVQHTTSVFGYNLLSTVTNTYSAFFFITLDPWSERYDRKNVETQNYRAISNRLNQELSTIPGAIGFSFPPPPIPGIGTAGGVTFMLQDRSGQDVKYLAENTQKFMAAAQKRPEIASINTTFSDNVPQIFVNVDREKALKQQLDLANVYQTIQAFMGGAFINYFNRFGRQWQVYVEAEGKFRQEADNLGRFYVRNKDGQSVPLSTLISIENTYGPEYTQRFNMFRSAQINVGAAEGYSTGQVMAALEQVFEQTMPQEMGFAYSGMSYEEKKAADGVSPVAIFGISLLFVFLILAALYESWSLPFSVLLCLPIAVFGAFFALWMRGMENNIYAQIGMVMLIGLAAKNAILIVEFAKMKYEEGMTLMDAALEGARLRLRPILMTSFAFILGCVPLWIALGSGAVSRRILGTTVIGGMLASTVIAIFIIPVAFYLVERYIARKPNQIVPAQDAENSGEGKV